VGAPNEADSFLMGGGIPSCSFLTKGTSHEGEILDIQMRQQRDIQTGKPKFWDDGSKMMQMVVTLQTEEFDEELDDDDGRRNLYIAYKMKEAVAKAVKEAEAPGLRVGGYLKVTFTAQGKPKKRGYSGTKFYEAEYTPPDEDAENDDYLADEDDDAEDEAPRRPAKKAPTKMTKKAAGRRRAEPEGDDAEEDEPEPPRRRGPAKKAPAKKAAGRRRAEPEGDEYADEDDEPGF
jgi:hypothetical protein